MAVTTDSLLTEISVDTADAKKSLADLVKSFDTLNEKMEETGQHTKEAGKHLEGMGFMAVKLEATLQLAEKAFEFLKESLVESVGAFAKEDAALSKLSATLKVAGQYTEAHVEHLKELAETLELTANVSAEASLQMITLGKSAGLSDAQTEKFVKTAANMAVLLEGDVSGAFRDLLGQLSGMPGRIARNFPELAKFTDAQLRAGKGVEYLSNHLEDLAKVQATTFSGSILGVHLVFDVLLKTIGRFITETLKLPQVLNFVKNSMIELNEQLKLVIPKVEAVVDRFTQVDWHKVGEGILFLAGSFVILKAAIAAVTFVSAVGGIATVADAIAALELSFEGIMATLAGVGEAIAGAFVAAAPIVAMTLGVIALAATAEALYNNFDKLPQLFQVVGEAGKIAFEGLYLGAVYAIKGVEQFAAYLTEVVAKVTGLGGELAASLRGEVADEGKEIDRMTKLIGGNMEKIKKDSKGLDFGLAGEAVKFIAGSIADMTKHTGEAGKATKDWNDKQREVIMNMQEQLKLITEIKDKNEGLFTDIANIGVTQSEQIFNNMELDLKRLDIKMQQLNTEGKLSDELRAQYEITKGLTIQKAGKLTERVEHPNVVNPDQLKAITDAFGKGAGTAASSIGSAAGALQGVMGGVGAVMGAINGVLDFVQQLIDFIPQVLEKIANIFNTLTDLPLKIAAGVADLMKGLVNVISNLVPNLFKAVPDLINSLLTGLLQQVPKAVEKLVEQLPTIISAFLDRLPDLMEKLVSGLITAMPRIAIALQISLVKEAPKIALAIMKTIYIELPKAIVSGIVQGVTELLDMIKSVFTGIKMPELDFGGMVNAFKAAGKELTGATSQIFAVKDLSAAASANDQVKKLANAVKDASNWLLKAWQALVNMLLAAWRWIYDTLLKPWVDMLKAAWQHVVETLQAAWDGIVTVLKATWAFIEESWNVLVDYLKAVWDSVMTVFNATITFLKTIWDTMMAVFEGKISILQALVTTWRAAFDYAASVLGAVASTFRALFDGIGAQLRNINELFKATFGAIITFLDSFRASFANMGAGIWDGFRRAVDGGLFAGFGNQIWDALRNGVSGLGAIIRDQLNAINPGNLLQKMFAFDGGGKGDVENALSRISGGNIDVPFVKFAEGGLVPGSAAVAGNSPLNDRILAMLSPGEAVIPKSVMENKALAGIVHAILGGKMKVPGLFGGSVSVGGASIGVSDSGVSVSAGGTSVGAGVGGITVNGMPAGQVLANSALSAAKGAETFGQKAWDSLKKGAQWAFDQFGNLDPQRLWAKFQEKGMQAMWDMMSAARFHTGGMIPGYAAGGDVPALLQPGEFVMSRSATSRIGASNLAALNSGGGGGSQTVTQNFEINIKTTEPIDEKFFRNSLMPKITDEIRRASLDGKFVISGTGIR